MRPRAPLALGFADKPPDSHVRHEPALVSHYVLAQGSQAGAPGSPDRWQLTTHSARGCAPNVPRARKGHSCMLLSEARNLLKTRLYGRQVRRTEGKEDVFSAVLYQLSYRATGRKI